MSMAVINVLEKHVAELIAAGEVVERPASIVKELLENAIDAGAKNISVEILGGGVRMIRITDDGCGISREDLPKAFLRHATSKVRDANDLDSILTLGFRGEALASVAAMCRVEIITKTAEENEGTAYSIEGGNCTGCVPAGCPTGTTITVRDVFFNTPARVKFLKKDVSEGNSVAQVVDKCALSHPEIAFKFIRDGAVKLKTSGGGDLLAVIYAIHGREFANEMLAVDYVYEKFARVSGYISKPGAVKPSRTYQTFFINGRFVKTRTGAAALEEAYKNKIMGGKHPACFLNIELDAADVDVNVHPTKLEVRFVNEKPVFSSVYYAVKTALQKLETPLGIAAQGAKPIADMFAGHADEMPIQQRLTAAEYRERYAEIHHAAKGDTGLHEPQQVQYTNATAEEVTGKTAFIAEPQQIQYTDIKPVSFTHKPLAMRSSRIDISVDDGEDFSSYSSVSTGFGKILPQKIGKISESHATKPDNIDTIPTEHENHAESIGNSTEFRLIGELFETYILLEQNGELVVLDKHAAHERILYEKLKAEISYGNRQMLLAAQSVALSREEHTALLESLEQVERLGFLIEDFGGSTVVVREVPIELSSADIEYILREIADKLKNGSQDLTPHVLDRLYYSIACRSAIKARDKSSAAELNVLVRQLQENPSITHCPHGRPVLVRMTRREIEKLFGRI